MKTKRLIDNQRRRSIPESFGWVDHRFVRDGLIKSCGTNALALYLFLITVSDGDGLSYYSDEKSSFLLSMSRQELELARKELLQAGWILWNGWLYQVLDLVRPERPVQQRRGRGEARSLKHVLAGMIGEVADD